MKVNKVQNVLNIKYASASLQDIAKAEMTDAGKCRRILSANTYEDVIAFYKAKDKFTSYPTYENNGKLTLVGKAERLTDLKKYGLDKNATIGEFFKKFSDKMTESFKKMIGDIEKFHKENPNHTTMGPKP